MDVLTTYNNWRYKMIPVTNKRKRRWSFYCNPASNRGCWEWATFSLEK